MEYVQLEMNVNYRPRTIVVKPYRSLYEKCESWDDYRRSAHYRCHVMVRLALGIPVALARKLTKADLCALNFADIIEMRRDETFDQLYELRGRPGPDAPVLADEDGERMNPDSFLYYEIAQHSPPREYRKTEHAPLASLLKPDEMNNGAENLAGVTLTVTVPNYNGPYPRTAIRDRRVSERGSVVYSELASGVYILYSRGETVYVGVTKDIDKRIRQHSEKEYDSFAFIETEDGAHVIEAALIARYKPMYNTVGARPHGPRSRDK